MAAFCEMMASANDWDRAHSADERADLAVERAAAGIMADNELIDAAVSDWLFAAGKPASVGAENGRAWAQAVGALARNGGGAALRALVLEAVDQAAQAVIDAARRGQS